MSHDNFALFSVMPGQKIEEEDCNRFEMAVKIVGGSSLFGVVHKLCNESFDEHWQERFDEFMAEFYRAYAGCGGVLTTFFLYLCEFNGTVLRRRVYIRGKSDGCDEQIELAVNVPAKELKVRFGIKTLLVEHNLTVFCNPNYYFDYDG